MVVHPRPVNDSPPGCTALVAVVGPQIRSTESQNCSCWKRPLRSEDPTSPGPSNRVPRCRVHTSRDTASSTSLGSLTTRSAVSNPCSAHTCAAAPGAAPARLASLRRPRGCIPTQAQGGQQQLLRPSLTAWTPLSAAAPGGWRKAEKSLYRPRQPAAAKAAGAGARLTPGGRCSPARRAPPARRPQRQPQPRAERCR